MDFEDFVVARGDVLLRFALMTCGHPQQAEDLMQSVLARAYLRWSKISSMERPEAYLKAMVVNEHLGWRRRRLNRELPAPEFKDEAANPDMADGQAGRDAVWRLLQRLPPRQRVILVLRYYEDLSDDQIAGVLGCAASTVRSGAARALAALRAVASTRDQEVWP